MVGRGNSSCRSCARPTWSPDGSIDLWRLDLNTGTSSRLTREQQLENHAQECLAGHTDVLSNELSRTSVLVTHLHAEKCRTHVTQSTPRLKPTLSEVKTVALADLFG